MIATHRARLQDLAGRWLAVVLLAVVTGLLGAAPAGAADPPYGYTTDRAEAAAWWLNGELDRITAAARAGQPVDVGLALDDVLAVLALGYERDAVDRVMTAIEPRIRAYVAAEPTTPMSGNLGKTLATALATGRGGGYGGIDLEGELRANMVTEGRRAGEFPSYRDLPEDPDPVYGQGFTQSWAILALARTQGGVPPEAVGWLLQMQCPTGGFRVSYPQRATDPCPKGGHVDATAMSIQALLALPDRAAAVDGAIARAAAWLVAVQYADGGFDDNDRQPPNTNSTGLAAQALRAAGRGGAAADARGWVEDRQILCVPDRAHRGAFTYAAVGAEPGGDGPRAIPQAVMALGLPAYGAVGGGGAVEADPYWCPEQGDPTGPKDGPGPGRPPPDPIEPPPDSTPDPEPTPDPVPRPPGGPGDGEGAGPGSGPGTGTGGLGTDGPAGDGSGSDDPIPGEILSIFASDEPEEGSEVEAQRAKDADAVVGPLDATSAGRRPVATASGPRPDPLGPTVVAAGVGLAVVAFVGVRTGHLSARGRRRARPAMATSAATSRSVSDDGTGTRTEDLPAGPYG